MTKLDDFLADLVTDMNDLNEQLGRILREGDPR